MPGSLPLSTDPTQVVSFQVVSDPGGFDLTTATSATIRVRPWPRGQQPAPTFDVPASYSASSATAAVATVPFSALQATTFGVGQYGIDVHLFPASGPSEQTYPDTLIVTSEFP